MFRLTIAPIIKTLSEVKKLENPLFYSITYDADRYQKTSKGIVEVFKAMNDVGLMISDEIRSVLDMDVRALPKFSQFLRLVHQSQILLDYTSFEIVRTHIKRNFEEQVPLIIYYLCALQSSKIEINPTRLRALLDLKNEELMEVQTIVRSLAKHKTLDKEIYDHIIKNATTLTIKADKLNEIFQELADENISIKGLQRSLIDASPETLEYILKRSETIALTREAVLKLCGRADRHFGDAGPDIELKIK